MQQYRILVLRVVVFEVVLKKFELLTFKSRTQSWKLENSVRDFCWKHTRNNTAPANSAMTESVKEMVVFSEEH